MAMRLHGSLYNTSVVLNSQACLYYKPFSSFLTVNMSETGPISSGKFIITNVHHNKFVTLNSTSQKTPIIGGTDSSSGIAHWKIQHYVDGDIYSIENPSADKYVIVDPNELGAPVQVKHAAHAPMRWTIKETADKGIYKIEVANTHLHWGLMGSGANIPVTLNRDSTEDNILWTFTYVD